MWRVKDDDDDDDDNNNNNNNNIKTTEHSNQSGNVSLWYSQGTRF
jgi:hypothetical protein